MDIEFEQERERERAGKASDFKETTSNFQLKENHLKLLRAHENGKIILKSLKQENKKLSHFKKDKANKIIDGMVRNLTKNGYLISESRGVYKLSDLGHQALTKEFEMKLQKRKNKIFRAGSGIKITVFDKLLEQVSDDKDCIDPWLLAIHPKSEAINKRITTLQQAGFINDNSLTPEFIERLGLAKLRGKNKNIRLNQLTKKQLELMQDMSIFLNLIPRQIEEHIYQGNKNLMACDLRYLVEKNVLQKAIDHDVYVLDKQGVRLYKEVRSHNAVRYNTKLFGKTSELNHDILIYDAYKDLEAKLQKENMKIVEIKNDRQLRHESSQQFGHMQGEFPDLRVFYQSLDDINAEVRFQDIEVDVGYDAKTISKKLEGFFADEAGYYQGGGNSTKTKLNFNIASDPVKEIGWYCNSLNQALKVAKSFKSLEVKNKSSNKVQKLVISIIDKDGKIKKHLW